MSAAIDWPFGEPETIVGDWIDSVSGYRCVVLVGPMGSLNGYVQVPDDHPWFGKGYSDCLTDCGDEDCYYDHSPCERISVHGGLTYAGEGVTAVGTGGWWFGFDCAHAGDVTPRTGYLYEGDVLRGPEYVGAEVSRLAHQLAEAAA